MSPVSKYFYPRLASTNQQAFTLVSDRKLKSTAWIHTECQFAGKGHGSNVWHSSKGRNITGSLVYFPDHLEPTRQFEISMAVSLAVATFLEIFVEQVKIKWPNDLYVGDEKIAGLLIENGIMGSRIVYSIIGIGLNVNQLQFPSALPNPVSLKKLTGLNYNIGELMDILVDLLLSYLDRLHQNDSDRLLQDYLKKLYRYKEFAPFKSLEGWFYARIVSIDSFGYIILEDEKQQIRQFGFKEVEYII